MEEKYKQFEKINWEKNEDWQIYFSNLTPTPPGNRVLYYKKKFYKHRIDYEFDVNYDPSINDKKTNFSYENNNINSINITHSYTKIKFKRTL